MGCLYPGRVLLGIGISEALNEIATGLRASGRSSGTLRAATRISPTDARAVARESRRLQRRVLHRTRGLCLRCARDGIPVYIATGGPVAARYAGDGFICTSGKGMGLYSESLLPAAEEGATKTERDLVDIDRMIEIKISYDPDRSEAL